MFAAISFTFTLLIFLSLFFMICGRNNILELKSNYYTNKLEKYTNKSIQLWNRYKTKYKKIYKNEEDEDIHMKEFFDKIKLISNHNRKAINGNELYYLNINHFTDYTSFDYQKMIGESFNVSSKIFNDKIILNKQVPVPKAIDWRHYGAVTDIKNQGLCGNGWIFASNGAIEAVWKGKTGNLISFSSQAVADCTKGDSCTGGWIDNAFEYSKHYGMIKENDYPYKFKKDGECNYTNHEIVGKISRWIQLQAGNEEYLKFYVGTVGPIVVGIDASLKTFQTYSYGIYDDSECGHTLNHVVLLIGYGKDDINGDYWIGKNSYGLSWGEQGYFRIRRGINRCGIALAAAAPIAVNDLISTFFNNSDYNKINNDWKQYKIRFKKYFKNNSEEVIHKMEFFNIKNTIDKHNELFKKGKTSFQMMVNDMSDLTSSNYHRRRGLKFNKARFKVNQNEDLKLFGSNVSVPSSIDWREYNRVSPIQNQKDCGSCWIFAANGAMEGAYAKKTGKLYSLSVQQIADCTYGNACDGGWMITAYRYAKIRGLTTTKEYPYTGKDRKCNLKGKKLIRVIKKWINLGKNEERLKKVVGTIGPVAVGMDASLTSFKNYKSGIYDDPSCTNKLDHAVLIIGYGTDSVFGKYWIVKNSWGTSWGEKGYFKIKRGVNQCGIGEAPSYPIT
uniref:Cathepsin L-like n=1 Tax=Strongyloides stercoralis TaxID=6248 RepID=A0AAF5D8D7_STRER